MSVWRNDINCSNIFLFPIKKLARKTHIHQLLCDLYLSVSVDVHHTVWKKVLTPHLRRWNRYGTNFCASIGTKLTVGWNVPVTASQQNPTLTWPDFHFSAKWDRRSLKPRLRWSFPQNLPSHCGKFESTIACCCCFFQFSLIVLIMPHPTSICIRHGVPPLAREGMQQSTIAGSVGLTRATVNHILWGHAATRMLVPGKSTDGPEGSLHKGSGHDSVDEQFVWNGGWPENHQQPALVPWLLCI